MVVGGLCHSRFPSLPSCIFTHGGGKESTKTGRYFEVRTATLGVYQPRHDWTVLRGRNLPLGTIHATLIPRATYGVQWGDALVADGR